MISTALSMDNQHTHTHKHTHTKSTYAPIFGIKNKDYRPIALTSVVMKCLEKIMVRMLKVEIASHLDPLRFAYRAGRSTEDAVISVTHLINKHLETPAAYARVLFADFSSAFDTIHPLLLIQKLIKLEVSPNVIQWFHSFVTNRSQQVRINNTLSDAKPCSIGIPQGAVSSPILFTLYTNDCRSREENNYIPVIKYSDDTIILSLLKTGDSLQTYFNEISSFRNWCERNHLKLNIAKTKEMVFDPKKLGSHNPVVIGDIKIEQVVSYKYLGIHMDNQLKWNVQVDCLCAKLGQRLHFLRRLRLFGVSTNIMILFYNAVLESLIRYGMAAWFGPLTVQLKSKVERLVKTAMKVMNRRDYPSLQSIFEKVMVNQAHKILDDPTHILHTEYELLPSGKRFRAISYKSNRFKQSFLPTSVALLNKTREGRKHTF